MDRSDPERSRVVIRLVYDGPAWAGKTTTLRSLARTLGAEVFSGEEADGRTLHFDWVEYVGGLFQGLPIQCQIVGVPGQRVLERRRRMLLETADVVVFVADSRPDQMDENVHAFALLRQVTGAAMPPVATVVQANKRDLAGAVPLDELRERLGGGPSLAMTESVAKLGEGIRETFVLAVRLALDRERAQGGSRVPADGKPVVESGRELLELMLAAEGHSVPAASPRPAAGRAAAAQFAGVVERADTANTPELSSVPQRAPRMPDSTVLSGLVWPPVNGRVTVHEASREPLLMERTVSGDWLASSRTWRFLSPVEALYFDLEGGRQALIGWARWHAAAGQRLSGARAIAMTEAAPGAWRLWQIVRYVPTLRDACRDLVALNDHAIGERLFRIIDLRLRAERELVSSGWLARVDLGSVGASEVGEPIFTGFAPFAAELPHPGATPSFDEERLIEKEIGPALQNELSFTPARLQGVLLGVHLAAAAKERRQVAEALRRALLGA